MSLINKLIIWANEQGLQNLFYQSPVVLSFLAVFLFFEFYRRHYHLKRGESIAALVLTYPLSYFWMLLITWIENGFRNFGDNNMVRLYVWVPLFVVLAAKILSKDSRRLLDFFAPAAVLVQGIGHCSCVFAGCCHGYPCDWGVVNVQLSQVIWSANLNQAENRSYIRVFPTQFLECLVALGIFFFLIIYAKKTKYDCRGKMYPLFLVLFGVTRFFLEFLRDNPKVALGISELALHALSMVAVGTVWLIVLKKKHKKESC